MVQLDELVKVPNHSEWNLYRLDRGRWILQGSGIIFRNMVVVGYSVYVGSLTNYCSTATVQKAEIEKSNVVSFRTRDSFYRLERIARKQK